MRILLENDPATVVAIAGTLFAIAMAWALLVPPMRNGGKFFLFAVMSAAALYGTASLVWGAVQLNRASVSGGPVHWHADFRVVRCGEDLRLVRPSGLSNKIGTAVLHEHGDNRIHIEGTVADLADISLGRFFDVVGGHLRTTEFAMPTTEGFISMKNGDSCSDGKTGELQVFAWTMEGDLARQTRLADPASYVIRPEALVPPGDCIIIEFGPRASRTERICEQYALAEQTGKIFIEKR